MTTPIANKPASEMTVRESFSQAIMAGVLGNWNGLSDDNKIARYAVLQADLLIAELESTTDADPKAVSK